MKDITIFENFINDEELEEARQFIGGEYSQHWGSRKWFFNDINNSFTKILIDSMFNLNMENIIPSAKNFILKIKNRIDKCMNTNLDIHRVYFNRQVCGQDVPSHTDAEKRVCLYTLLIYIGDITPENYDKTGGDLEIQTKPIIRIEPFTKRAVLFKGYIPHQAYAPLVHGITRISFAINFICSSERDKTEYNNGQW